MADDKMKWPRVAPKELKSFVERIMIKSGCKPSHSEALAELLVVADTRGHYSHGLNRLDYYLGDVEAKIVDVNAEPCVVKDMPATAWVDGNNVLGPAVGKFCIDLAIAKAKQVGMGMVVAKGSNHFGIAGWYSMRAAEQGLLGMAFTNTSPYLVPTRAKKPGLGTNPITLAAPSSGKNDDFVLDMATTTAALGKIEIAERKGQQLKQSWACNGEGQETLNPEEVLHSKGGLLPLGGLEETGGYKGYGLGMMVEVLCGILGGATYGKNVRAWNDKASVADLGQCFIAINPEGFAPGFPGRMADLNAMMRNLEPIEGETEVLIPGDPERKHIKDCEEKGGIPYHPNFIKHTSTLAKKFDVEDLPLVKEATK